MILLLAFALTSADCVGCHAEEGAAFERSRHANASQLAIFQAAVTHAPKANKAWCASCHRPAGERALGLQCTSCHGVEGDRSAIRASRPATPDAIDAHRVVVDDGFGKQSCARCHEFATPLPEHFDPVVYSSQPLQATASELARHEPRARCSGCHDPHAPLGAHDPATVRSAITVTARSTTEGVEVRITANRTGHRVPSGDPFRRVVISVCDDPACDTVLGKQVIARGFALVDGVWAPSVDHTLRDGETRVLRFGSGRWWRAEWFYGDPRFEASLPTSEVSLELASGPL